MLRRCSGQHNLSKWFVFNSLRNTPFVHVKQHTNGTEPFPIAHNKWRKVKLTKLRWNYIVGSWTRSLPYVSKYFPRTTYSSVGPQLKTICFGIRSWFQTVICLQKRFQRSLECNDFQTSWQVSKVSVPAAMHWRRTVTMSPLCTVYLQLRQCFITNSLSHLFLPPTSHLIKRLFHSMNQSITDHFINHKFPWLLSHFFNSSIFNNVHCMIIDRCMSTSINVQAMCIYVQWLSFACQLSFSICSVFFTGHSSLLSLSIYSSFTGSPNELFLYIQLFYSL